MKNDEDRNIIRENWKLYIIIGVIGVVIIGLVFMFAMRDVQKDEDLDSIVKNIEKEGKKEQKTTKDTLVKEVGFYIPTQTEVEQYLYGEDSSQTFQDVAYDGDMEKLISDYGYTEDQASVLQLLINGGNILTGQETPREQEMYLGYVKNLNKYIELLKSENLDEYLKYLADSKTTMSTSEQVFLNNPVLDYQSGFIGTFTSGFTKVSDKDNVYMGYPIIERYTVENKDIHEDIYFIEVQYLVGSDIPIEKLEKIAMDLKPSINGKIADTGAVFKDLRVDIEKNRSDDYKKCYASHDLVSSFCDEDTIDAEEIITSINSLDEIKLSFYKHSDVFSLFYNRGKTVLSGTALKAIYMVDLDDIPTGEFNINIGKEVYVMSEDASDTALPYKFN